MPYSSCGYSFFLREPTQRTPGIFGRINMKRVLSVSWTLQESVVKQWNAVQPLFLFAELTPCAPYWKAPNKWHCLKTLKKGWLRFSFDRKVCDQTPDMASTCLSIPQSVTLLSNTNPNDTSKFWNLLRKRHNTCCLRFSYMKFECK